MTEVLTSKLKSDTTRMFYQDIQDNDFYVFVSSVTQGTNRISASNSQGSKIKFLENTVFGKKVLGTDTKFMIKYHPWQKDQTYIQYDDQLDMTDKKFYAVVGPTNNDTGDYRVFKCLFNNNDSTSTAPPNWNPYTEGQVYRTADKYVWKFMYAITPAEFEAYNAVGFIPLAGDVIIDPDPNADANNVVYGSEISDIFVENPVDNAGYPSVSGFLMAAPGNDGTLTVRATGINQITNYYVGMSIYVTNPNGGPSNLYVISSYEFQVGVQYGKIKVIGNPLGDGVLNGSTFTVVPTCVVKGDGTGASALPNVIEGNISSLLILNSGSGYTNVTASIIDPLFDFDPEDPISIDVRADLRPVLSPKGGHGWNMIDEMHCRHILLYGYITEANNNDIGATNTYSHLGIVKNPEFLSASANSANTPTVFDNRIAVTTNQFNFATVDTVLTQTDVNNTTTFTGKVHEVDETSNTVYIASYMGPYPNAANNDNSFDYTNNLINPQGQRITINSPKADNTVESDYVQRSGTVYFMEDFVPLARTSTSREEYKLVLEF
jgi:hypothetical protein|tara:strand:+ start:5117 stop:6760 length:1644 start_codon:yes stop_codon:yes gene_type:complete